MWIGTEVEGTGHDLFEVCSGFNWIKLWKILVTVACFVAKTPIRYLLKLKLCCVEMQIWNSVIAGSVVSADKHRLSACTIHWQIGCQHMIFCVQWLNFPWSGTAHLWPNVIMCTEILVTKGGWTPHRYKLEHHRLTTVWSAAEQWCLSDKSWVNTLQIPTGTS